MKNGVYTAICYVLRLGHKRLAAMVGPVQLTNSQRRLKRFKRAAHDNKILVGPEYIQETTFDRQAAMSKQDCYFV